MSLVRCVANSLQSKPALRPNFFGNCGQIALNSRLSPVVCRHTLCGLKLIQKFESNPLLDIQLT